ncbi:MAG: hypothetical protein JWN96_230, partial [Mycobacterium sp.]|nr:hypothetical protein [Mycobacterium sp.]
MFDSSQSQLGTDLVLLREVATRVARTIGPDTPGPAAAEALDELIGIARQLDLATVQGDRAGRPVRCFPAGRVPLRRGLPAARGERDPGLGGTPGASGPGADGSTARNAFGVA